MTRILLVVAVAMVACAAFVQAEAREWVSNGEVVSITPGSGTLTLEEIAEPPENSRPGTMQSGVQRPFTVPGDAKLTADGRTIALSDIHVGDHVTIHYVLEGGKNVTRSLVVVSRATE